MFTEARLKLTLWYVVTIMFISGCFSLAIYRLVSQEIERGFVRFNRRIAAGPFRLEISEPLPQPQFLEELTDAQHRVRLRLLYANYIILVFASIGGYLLAGKTLGPIETAHRDQKRFIADASHELKTPLTALHTSIEVALRDKTLNLVAAKQVLNQSLTDLSNLEKLTHNLLSLSQNSHLKLSIAPVDLDETIRFVVNKLKPLADQKKHDLKLKLTPLTIEADESKLIELFTILIDNAIKYTSKGKIILTSSVSGNKVTFTVSDTGVGIKANHLPHIFERFYQADTARTKGSSAGFGLGLTIAQQIVDLHHGSIKVKSRTGHGSTFTITLPLKQS